MARQWFVTAQDVLTEMDVQVTAAGQGQVTIEVKAVGVNPADNLLLRQTMPPGAPPTPIGFELAGVITALGPGARLGSGGGAVGDEVIAWPLSGSYATSVTVPAADVFAKPPPLSFPEAANLLLVGTTAADMLDAGRVGEGDTVLVHGASGAVGVSLMQQARLLGAAVIGTTSATKAGLVERFGAVAVEHGPGLAQRVLAAAGPGGVTAALDTAGTDEAIDVSLALISDWSRVVTIAAYHRAGHPGPVYLGRVNPRSAPFRAAARARVLQMAADRRLVVPMAQRFPLSAAEDALRKLRGPHAAGKFALVPDATV